MKLVSAEDLSGKERASFELLEKHFPSGAVCVNVMLTPESWDVRPLLLINGTVYLYRFSPPLPFDFLRHVVAEMEGFSLLPQWNTSVRSLPASDRFLASRPFVTSTLADLTAGGENVRLSDPLALSRQLVEQVLELDRRHLVHGHICPANVAIPSSGSGPVFLLDPRIGAFSGRKDDFCAPELEKLSDPQPSVDLFGLGTCLRAILGDRATSPQKELIDRLLLASPRQRPSLSDVAALFLENRAPSASKGEPQSATSRGRIIGGSLAAEQPQSSGASVMSPPAAVQQAPAPSTNYTVETRIKHRLRVMPYIRVLLGVLLLAITTLAVLKWRFPRLYNGMAHYVPILAAQNNPEYVAALASGDKARLRSVARAAVIDRDPAAITAIVEDISSGASRPGLNVSLFRAAYRSPWREEFSSNDTTTLIALTVAQVLPEGLKGLPALSSLHPSLVVAVAAQLSPGSPGEQLKSIPLSKLTALGDPEGDAFKKLEGLGVTTLADPLAIALSQVIAGTATTAAYDILIGPSTEVAATLERVALLLPVVMAKPALADQLLAAIRDRGGDPGTVLGWFDIDSLVAWKEVPAAAKLLLILEQVPSVGLSASQYADLLKFPLPAVREKAAEQLRSRGVRQVDTQVLKFLTSEQNRLSRSQTVALLSGLFLDPLKRAPFVALWFQMQPPAETTLLILLARSACDDKDLFNLEAARYLKKHSWPASSDVLTLLAQHPEPLARSLAYARLDPGVPEQKKILQQRISSEKDVALLKAVTAKLSP